MVTGTRYQSGQRRRRRKPFVVIGAKLVGLFFKNQGLLQIKQHALGKKHRTVADIKKRRNRSQQVLISSSVAEDVANNNCDEVEGGNRRGGLVLQSLIAPPSLPRMDMSINDRVTAAETLFVLKAVGSNYSYSSLEDWKDILCKADSNSDVFPKLKLSRTKASYMDSKEFYPHFHQQLVHDICGAPAFTVAVIQIY